MYRYTVMYMSSNLFPSNQEDDEEDSVPLIEEPVNIRPDLSALGILEHQRGICEDTFENRSILRSAQMGWDTVYATNGVPTGLIQARSKDMVTQRRILSLAEKRPILVDPKDMNSDYLTGLDLVAEVASDNLVPTWVLGATRMWVNEQDNPIASAKRKPTALPHRCRQIKDDKIRCMLWSSGRIKDDGLCRVHLRHVRNNPSDDIERARKRLVQAAPYAVDILEDLMLNAVSEPVKLKASTEILDRAGVRGGIELDGNISVTDVRPAADIISERLNRLASGAIHVAASLASQGVPIENVSIDESDEGTNDVVDADIQETGTTE
jgi:hypothetical protein